MSLDGADEPLTGPGIDMPDTRMKVYTASCNGTNGKVHHFQIVASDTDLTEAPDWPICCPWCFGDAYPKKGSES